VGQAPPAYLLTGERWLVISLDDCTKGIATVLVATVVLADLIGREVIPNEMVKYSRAIGEITLKYFHTAGHPRGVHNPSPRSLAQVKSVRASNPRWGGE